MERGERFVRVPSDMVMLYSGKIQKLVIDNDEFTHLQFSTIWIERSAAIKTANPMSRFSKRAQSFPRAI